MTYIAKNIFAVFLTFISVSISYAMNIEDYLKEQTETLIQDVNIIDFQDQKYIVSIYSVDLQNLDVEKRIELMKMAVIKSESNLSTFIHDSEILNKEKLTSQSIKHNDNIEFSEEYIEVIQEKSNGVLKNLLRLDFKKDNIYNVIRYIPL